MVFSESKTKKCTKKAVKGKFAPKAKGNTTVTRSNKNAYRKGEGKNSTSPDLDYRILRGQSVNPNAMAIEVDDSGNLTTRRKTRKEELNETLRRAAHMSGGRAVVRYDAKDTE